MITELFAIVLLCGLIMIALFALGSLVLAFIPDQGDGHESECDYDESLCVLGIPDPDFLEADNDTGE